jgi:hypothetical protein
VLQPRVLNIFALLKDCSMLLYAGSKIKSHKEIPHRKPPKVCCNGILLVCARLRISQSLNFFRTMNFGVGRLGGLATCNNKVPRVMSTLRVLETRVLCETLGFLLSMLPHGTELTEYLIESFEREDSVQHLEHLPQNEGSSLKAEKFLVLQTVPGVHMLAPPACTTNHMVILSGDDRGS